MTLFSKKDLFKLILPLVVEQVLMGLVGIADALMVSSVGEVAMSGVSLVDSLNLLVLGLFSSLATGGSIVTSQYLGKKDDQNANTAGKHLIVVMILFSLAIGVFALAANGWILNGLYGAAEDTVINQARIYFYTAAASYPFIGIFDSYSALFRAMGDSKTPMISTLLMNIINVGLNALFIYGFQWGIFGAGLASLIARMFSAIMLVILLRRPKGRIWVNSLKISYHLWMVKNILRIAVPTGLENSVFHVGKLLVQRIVTSFGTAAIAANAVVLTISEFSHMAPYAIGLAMITVVGQCVGAGDFEQAKRYMIKLNNLAYIVTGVICVLSWVLADGITWMYHLTPQTAEIAKQIIIYHAITCIFLWPSSFTLPMGLQAANDVKFTMIHSILSMWVFRVGLSYLISMWFDVGVLGVWIAMSADWLYRAVVYIWRLMSGRWKNRQFI